MVRDTQQSCCRCGTFKDQHVHVFVHPAWVSTLRRKQRADCSPRFFLRGLHAPAAGPQPTERQGLHPSRPKGPLTHLFSCGASVLLSLLHSTFLPIRHCFHLASQPPLLQPICAKTGVRSLYRGKHSQSCISLTGFGGSDNNKLWTGHFWNHVMNQHEPYCLTWFQFK